MSTMSERVEENMWRLYLYRSVECRLKSSRQGRLTSVSGLQWIGVRSSPSEYPRRNPLQLVPSNKSTVA
jgi:hypothetical protein